MMKFLNLLFVFAVAAGPVFGQTDPQNRKHTADPTQPYVDEVPVPVRSDFPGANIVRSGMITLSNNAKKAELYGKSTGLLCTNATDITVSAGFFPVNGVLVESVGATNLLVSAPANAATDGMLARVVLSDAGVVSVIEKEVDLEVPAEAEVTFTDVAQAGELLRITKTVGATTQSFTYLAVAGVPANNFEFAVGANVTASAANLKAAINLTTASHGLPTATNAAGVLTINVVNADAAIYDFYLDFTDATFTAPSVDNGDGTYSPGGGQTAEAATYPEPSATQSVICNVYSPGSLGDGTTVQADLDNTARFF